MRHLRSAAQNASFEENGIDKLGPLAGFALMILRQEMMILGQMQLLEVGFGCYSA